MNNENTENAISRLRELDFRTPSELAEILKKEDAHFSAPDLIALGSILAARFGRHGGMYSVPEWLVGVISSIAGNRSGGTICDPWAGVGFLIGALRESTKALRAIAFTRNPDEMALGRVLVPQAEWTTDEPLRLIDKNESLDVVASVLPMNLRTQEVLTLTLAPGKAVKLTDDLGNLLLIDSILHLSDSGVGLFVVPPSFFLSSRPALELMSQLDIGIDAALALPPGTFAPYTNISTYLIVAHRYPAEKMFVAQLTGDSRTNSQVIDNLRQGREGGSLTLGRFVDAAEFKSIEHLRALETLQHAEQRFGVKAVELAELSDVKSRINLGRPGDEFAFPAIDNAIYIPLIGNSDVVESPDELTIKPQNYAQVVIDPSRSVASFVARFLNSDFGKQLREQNKTGVIPRLNTPALRTLRVFVPDLLTQRKMLAIESRITAEQATVLGLQNELATLRREIWANPTVLADVEQQLGAFAERLSGRIKQHAAETLSQWFETLPFPLASILRAWQATPSHDFKTRHEHLLHFFEATAEFISVILLSAFGSNEGDFVAHRQRLAEAMARQNLSFTRATFGTWKFVVEYFGKQTRDLLREDGKNPNDAKNDLALCGDMFADPLRALPRALCRKELAAILTRTNKMRNDWAGHGGVVGQEEAESRNRQLLVEVEHLREAIADTWARTQLIHALHCIPRGGQFENEVSVLMGSNNEFLKETRPMATWLDVERLYLSTRDSGRALKLLPLIRVGPSPQSARNACYFFNRLEHEGARFISYHFVDKPELTGQFVEATDAIKLLTENKAKP